LFDAFRQQIGVVIRDEVDVAAVDAAISIDLPKVSSPVFATMLKADARPL
jgi:hypothetical protein